MDWLKIEIDQRFLDLAVNNVIKKVDQAAQDSLESVLPKAKSAMTEVTNSMIGFLHSRKKTGLDSIFKPYADIVNDTLVAGVNREIPKSKLYAYTQVEFNANEATDKVIFGRPMLVVPFSVSNSSHSKGTDPIAYEQGKSGYVVVRNEKWAGLKDIATKEMVAKLTRSVTIKEKSRAPLYSIKEELTAEAVTKIVESYHVTFTRVLSSRGVI